MPSFDSKRIPPFYNDSETLDLSPSGRYASRTLEHSAAQKTLVNTAPTPPSKAVVVSQPRELDCSNSNTVADEVNLVNVPLVSQNHTAEELDVVQPAETGVPVVGGQAQAQPEMDMDVSDGSGGTGALVMCPIDMSAQEQAKLERKREKNRYAAQKCRMLKLERIDRLQQRVNELKAQNVQLAGHASSLCEQVNRLRQLIVEHVEGGCQVMMVHNSAT